MSYEKVLQAKKVVIGSKQTVKALKEGKVQELIVANDADQNVTSKLIQHAQELNVAILYVDSMEKLGKSCGIEVGAAAVAIIR